MSATTTAADKENSTKASSDVCKHSTQSANSGRCPCAIPEVPFVVSSIPEIWHFQLLSRKNTFNLRFQNNVGFRKLWYPWFHVHMRSVIKGGKSFRAGVSDPVLREHQSSRFSILPNQLMAFTWHSRFLGATWNTRKPLMETLASVLTTSLCFALLSSLFRI